MTIDSPCISICDVDPNSEQCLGCGRTLDEIAGWLGYSDSERAAITAGLPARLEHDTNGAQSLSTTIGTTSSTVTCPYCNERYELVIDPSVALQSYVEDCFVCCRPILFTVSVNDDTVSVDARAENE